MVTRAGTFLSLALSFFLLLATPLVVAQNQSIEATVDQQQVNRGETLELTIRVYEQRQAVQLDLTSLTNDFEVLGHRTSSQIRSINGTVESWTDYIVTLLPLKEGSLMVPPLNINGELTRPLTITVVNAGPQSNQSAKDLFLEIEVNKDAVFVQEQLLFTIRLFYTISGIRNPQFTELEMPNSVIQLIGSPNQYEQLIDGVRYGVYEKRYVIFPQRSGDLEIPDILFRGEVTDGSSNFVFRNLNVGRVTAFIDGTTVKIKERPQEMQGEAIWLPASSIRLEENWSTDPSNLRIGESINRTITLVAEGLDGAVLPPFMPTNIRGLNVYAEPADIQRTFVEGSIVGTRIETASLVPTDSGIIELPEISIPWWNTEADQLEIATIPSRSLVVATAQGVIPAEQTVASTGNLDLSDLSVPVVDQAMIDQQNQAEVIEVNPRWLNYLIAFSIIVVLFSIYKLVLAKHRPALARSIRNRAHAITEKYSPGENELVAYRVLDKAIKSNDLLSIRESLVVWADHFFENISINSMDDLLKQQQQNELKNYCLAIQSDLYNGNLDSVQQSFDPRGFRQLLAALRKNKRKSDKQKRRDASYQLPPLYRT